MNYNSFEFSSALELDTFGDNTSMHKCFEEIGLVRPHREYYGKRQDEMTAIPILEVV